MDKGNGLLALSILMVVAGIALIVWAGLRGEAEFYLVLIIPVISGSGGVFAAGVLLLIFGIMLLFFAMSLRSVERYPDQTPQARPPARSPRTGEPPTGGGARWGGVVFIGPIPITFGSGPRMGRLMVVAAIIMALLMLAFFLGIFI
ncbi:MAG: DUF131 domain-containing protein [Thermoplasmata archaeon]|nr:DUF131 domain-containing protein [Thermoplasmata archaeon]